MFEAKDNAVISGNGSEGLGGTNIIIDDGIFVGKIQTSGYIACGIYHPQAGTLTVNGGRFYVFNGVGLLMRSGEANLNGGTFQVGGAVSGKVGDSSVLPECNAICVDTRAKYPAYETTVVSINGGSYTAQGSNGVVPDCVKVIPAESDLDADTRIKIFKGRFSPVIDDTYVQEGHSITIDGNVAIVA